MFPSFLNRRNSQQSPKTKRKWKSNESVNEEAEVDCELNDLQTPPNKRSRKFDQSQEGSGTPFEKVSSWVKKTVRIFKSFAEKYTFWQDDVDHDSGNEIVPLLSERPAVMKHSSLEQQESSRVCMTRGRDEATPSYWKETTFKDHLSRRPLHEHTKTKRKFYDPSRYDGDSTRDQARKEFWPPFTTSKKEAGKNAGAKNTSINVLKTKANGSAQEIQPLQNKKWTHIKTSMVDTVVRLQEREKYRQLLAHYTSSSYVDGGCSSVRAISIDQESEKCNTNNISETSIKRISKREQSLLSPTVFPEQPSQASIIEVPQPVRLQVSPSRAPPRTVDVSRIVSDDTSKGVLDHGISNRRTTNARSFSLLDDNWITKWKETLSAENLEREREIAKEKLKFETIRKEKDDDDKISEEVKARMKGKYALPVIEKVDSFKELTPEMNRLIDKALCRGAANEQLVETALGGITRGDIATLGQQNWLNDEVINNYFHIITDRSKKRGPKVHSFNTFFYSKLIKTGHASLRRWTKKVDLFAMDMVLVPVHLGMHWCLAVIDLKTKTVSYYDSLKGENMECLQALREYLCAESLDKKKTKFDLTGWKTETPQNIPEQLNGCDCGVFICKYAEYISRRANFDFTQYDMPYFRRRMIGEILSKTLL